MEPTKNTLRLINACHSMTNCDIQRSWDLLATRAVWNAKRGTPITSHFVEAVRFYSERYDGRFYW